MNTKKILLSLSTFALVTVAQAQTLEECQRAAAKNYPEVQQYGLIEKTTQFTLSNIAKGWLPQVSASAQATYQSDVPGWPDEMKGLLQQVGVNFKGLKKDQYRVGVEAQQLVYDGGAIQAQRAVVREQGKAAAAQTAVNVYALRKRVNEMYFSLLLLQQQMQLNTDKIMLLESHEKQLRSLAARGVAAESDVQRVKAERIVAEQQAVTLDTQQTTLRNLLSILCGIEVNKPTRPPLPTVEIEREMQRPELKALDAQLSVVNAQEKALHHSLMPRVGLFAQGYYGYPGYNLFKDMMNSQWRLNGMVGARITWNLSPLYTYRNDRAKLQTQRAMVENQRELFLFNNRLERVEQQENIARYQRLVASDNELVRLRTSVRKAAESQLHHGIIEVNDLLREVNAENAARVQQVVHEMESLQQMYAQKITIGEE